MQTLTIAHPLSSIFISASEQIDTIGRIFATGANNLYHRTIQSLFGLTEFKPIDNLEQWLSQNG